MASSLPAASQLPLTSSSSISEKLSSQHSSLLLTRLPFEIRQEIYKDVIDSFGWGSKLHILSRDLESTDPTGKRKVQLTYIPCTLPPRDQLPPTYNPDTYYPSWPTQHQHCQGWKATAQAPPALRGTYLNMFLSCRQMYEEAIVLLYSEHSFAINSLSTTHRFLATVPQQHLNLIPNLHVTMIIPPFHLRGAPILGEMRIKDQVKMQEVEIEWLRSCSAMAKMTGLNSLEVDFWNMTHNELIEEEILKGLSPVKVADGGTFIVRVPCKGENSEPMVEKMSLAGITLERRHDGLEPVSEERYFC